MVCRRCRICRVIDQGYAIWSCELDDFVGLVKLTTLWLDWWNRRLCDWIGELDDSVVGLVSLMTLWLEYWTWRLYGWIGELDKFWFEKQTGHCLCWLVKLTILPMIVHSMWSSGMQSLAKDCSTFGLVTMCELCASMRLQIWRVQRRTASLCGWKVRSGLPRWRYVHIVSFVSSFARRAYVCNIKRTFVGQTVCRFDEKTIFGLTFMKSKISSIPTSITSNESLWVMQTNCGLGVKTISISTFLKWKDNF